MLLADRRSFEKLARQERFLEVLTETGSIHKAMQAVPITRRGYDTWRERDKDFAARATAIRLGARKRKKPWDGSFVDFRLRFFDHETPGFHKAAVDVLEKAKPYTVTMILWPPGHGKTTLLEDWCSYKLAVDPSFRITIGAESQSHARKMLRRVRGRMEADSPFPEYVARWGPFAPQQNTDRKSRQPWGADFFDVYKKGQFDERDYSMVGWGYGGSVIGSRTDLIVIDDPQSIGTLNLTDKIFETITQDWLSRMIGSESNVHCVIIGSRVGDHDIYQKLLDEGRVDDVVMREAHNLLDFWPAPQGRTAKEKRAETNLAPAGTRFLWPEKHKPQDYLDMRVNAGEAAWSRNFMMQPIATGESTFSDALIDKVKNPSRSVNHPPPPGASLVVGIDPSIGGRNATMCCAMTEDRIVPVHWRIDSGLTNNRQIFSIVEDYCLSYPEHSVTDLIIEDKAFQKGLMDDDALHDVRNHYGMRVTGHTTSATKMDDNIGVPGMARSFERNEIELPGAEDDQTTHLVALLRGELVRWRPWRKGTHLQQDLVMAMWFCWLRWRQLRTHLDHRDTPINVGGLPWQPTNIVIGVGMR